MKRERLAITEAPRPIPIKTNEGQREPRWLLLLTLLFVLGTIALLIFYAQLPSFLS